MNEKKYLLDYETFDDWTKVTSDFLKNKLSNTGDKLKQFFNEFDKGEIDRESYYHLSDERKLYLVLYGHHNFISKKVDLRDSFNELTKQFEKFKDSGQLLKVFGIHISQLIHKAFLALLGMENDTKMDDALILLSKQLPLSAKKINVMIPIVPIKSPFTVYIASVIVDLMTKLSKSHDIEYNFYIGWNEISYRKIKENLQHHLDFDKKLSTESLKLLIEENFRTSLYNLIIESQPKLPSEQKIRIVSLGKNFHPHPFELQQKINTSVSGPTRELEDISAIVLQDVSDYIRWESPNLIEYYGEIIADECTRLKDNEYIVFITPLPVGLMMDHFFEYLNEHIPAVEGENEHQKYTLTSQRVHYLCYLPFPGGDDIRDQLPFYFTEYSYLLYKVKPTSPNEKVSTKRDYIRRLLISAMKKLRLEPRIVASLDKMDYDQLVTVLTSIFAREDNRQKVYIRYV